MNLAGVIASLASGTYTVTRTDPGFYGSNSGLPMPLPSSMSYDGRYREGGTSTFTIRASIQPVRGRDLLRLPEGLRTQELITIWTDTPLRTASAPNGNTPDIVSYNGAAYQVQAVDYWAENGGYYKILAAKVGQ